MAYTPTSWVTGDVVTAEKLNNIESGIVGNETAIGNIKEAFIAEVTYDSEETAYSCDKTYAQIAAAITAGYVTFVNYGGLLYNLSAIGESSVSYSYLDVDASADTLTISTFVINASGVTASSAVYDLTDHT